MHPVDRKKLQIERKGLMESGQGVSNSKKAGHFIGLKEKRHDDAVRFRESFSVEIVKLCCVTSACFF